MNAGARLQGYLVARRTSVWQYRATDPSGNDWTFALKLPLSASCRGARFRDEEENTTGKAR